jgi:hypothetical protein
MPKHRHGRPGVDSDNTEVSTPRSSMAATDRSGVHASHARLILPPRDPAIRSRFSAG